MFDHSRTALTIRKYFRNHQSISVVHWCVAIPLHKWIREFGGCTMKTVQVCHQAPATFHLRFTDTRHSTQTVVTWQSSNTVQPQSRLHPWTHACECLNSIVPLSTLYLQAATSDCQTAPELSLDITILYTKWFKSTLYVYRYAWHIPWCGDKLYPCTFVPDNHTNILCKACNLQSKLRRLYMYHGMLVFHWGQGFSPCWRSAFCHDFAWSSGRDSWNSQERRVCLGLHVKGGLIFETCTTNCSLRLQNDWHPRSQVKEAARTATFQF